MLVGSDATIDRDALFEFVACRGAEWIPLYYRRVKASARYRQLGGGPHGDSRQGWFWNVICELLDSETPGFLPVNGTVPLWRLANAHSECFFEREKTALLACFKRRTVDGREYIYNARLLEILREQVKKFTPRKVERPSGNEIPEADSGNSGSFPESQQPTEKKRRRKPEHSLLFSSLLSSGMVSEIYKGYPRKEGSKVGKEAIARAILRLHQTGVVEYSDRHGHLQRCVIGCEADAGSFLLDAVREFEASAAGHRRKATGESLVPHPSTWFNQDRFADDRQQWHTDENQQPASIVPFPATGVRISGHNARTAQILSAAKGSFQYFEKRDEAAGDHRCTTAPSRVDSRER